MTGQLQAIFISDALWIADSPGLVPGVNMTGQLQAIFMSDELSTAAKHVYGLVVSSAVLASGTVRAGGFLLGLHA